jgi:hypothetical protein
MVHRQEQYFAAGGLLQDQSLSLIEGALEYMGIGYHHVGAVLEYLLQRFGSIPRLGYHFDVRFIFQQTPQTLAQQDMVMRQKTMNSSIAKNFGSFNLCVRTHRQLLELSARETCDAAQLGFGSNPD